MIIWVLLLFRVSYYLETGLQQQNKNAPKSCKLRDDSLSTAVPPVFANCLVRALLPLYRAVPAFGRRAVFAPPSAAALAPMCAALLGGCCAGVTASRVVPKLLFSISPRDRIVNLAERNSPVVRSFKDPGNQIEAQKEVNESILTSRTLSDIFLTNSCKYHTFGG
jgi:hypothetical protein